MSDEIIELAENRIPYWSRFVVDADLRWDGTNATFEQFSKGAEIPVFDYRRTESGVGALGGANATARDTILNKANETRGGAAYMIKGISLTKDGYVYEAGGENSKKGLIHSLPMPTAQPNANGTAGPSLSVEDFRGLDSFMLELLQKYFLLQLEVDGTSRTIEFGPTILYPGTGGPSGGNVDTSNGGTYVHNYMSLGPEGIRWNPSGASDSTMTMKLTAAYDCVTPTFTTPTGVDKNGDPIAGAVPTSLGRLWTQGWIMSLHGTEVKPVSEVA